MRRVAQTTRLVPGVLALAVLVGGCGSTAPSGTPTSLGTQAGDTLAALPLRFEPNLGQSDPRVTHISRGSDHTLLMTRRGAVLKLRAPGREDVVRMTFVGANDDPEVAGRGRLEGVSNYLRGSDPNRWVTGVPGFSQVVYSGLYDGVDLTFHASRAGELEFDYTLAAGVSPAGIRLAYSGVKTLRVDGSGALVLRTGGGEIRQAPPAVYQKRDGVRRRVQASYVLHGAKQVGFALKGYDPRAGLLIDPVLTYSTYLGGSDNEFAIWSDIDRSGNFYVTGVTSSPDFPTTNGAYQGQYNGGDDVFVTKLNPAGSGLVWSTYIGGASFDVAIGLDVDRAGNVVVTGPTGSSDFPTTRGAYQRQYAGGDSDTFVTKLDRSGSRLLFSTLLGGTAGEAGFISFLDERGNVYVEGETGSADFPTTRKAFQTTYGGGPADGFVTKLNPSGAALDYSTFIGGAGYDGAHDGWLDEHNNFYIDGPTESPNFPTTPRAFQRTLNGPSDAFAAKLNPRGTGVDYSTYLGGTGGEDVTDMTVDRFGNAYVPGPTDSTDFPVTPNAFQRTFGGAGDGYVAKLNPRGSALEYATYLGGSDADVAGGVRVDPDGNAHIPGTTSSPDFPVTPNALQPAYAGGPEDAFILTLNRTGSGLKFSTFLGGSGDDGSAGSGEWLDRQGNFYVPGFTDSTDFPVTAGAFQSANAGGYDVFLAKIAPRSHNHGDHDGDEANGGDVQALRHAPAAASAQVGRRTASRPTRGTVGGRVP
jgi:beta-propeller repeat-containing protein